MKKTIVLPLALALISAASAQAQVRTICRNPSDSRYIVKASMDDSGTPELSVIRFDAKSTRMIITFDDRFLALFFEDPQALTAIGRTSHSEVRLYSDSEAFGSTQQSVGEEAWKGKLYLNGKIRSQIQGDDEREVQSPVSVVCYPDI